MDSHNSYGDDEMDWRPSGPYFIRPTRPPTGITAPAPKGQHLAEPIEETDVSLLRTERIPFDPTDDSDDEFIEDEDTGASSGEDEDDDTLEDEDEEIKEVIGNRGDAANTEDEEIVSEADSDFDQVEILSFSTPEILTRPARGRGSRGGRGGRGGRGSRGGALRNGHRPKKEKKVPGGRRNLKGIKRGFRKPLPPSGRFDKLVADATNAFIEENFDEAEDLVTEAILENPEIFRAHSLLSEINMARHDKSRALTALFVGAHTQPRDTETWARVAEMSLDIETENRKSALLDAIYCYNRVLGVDRDNIQVRFRRSEINSELGNWKKAVYDYMHLLRLLPHNPEVLRHVAVACINIGVVPKAIEHYDKAIAVSQAKASTEPVEFDWPDANIYAGLFLSSGDYENGLSKVKRVLRWLLGRGNETFWDKYNDDDAEFDAYVDPRRSHIPEFARCEQTLHAYGQGVPLELRVKLGMLRLGLGQDHLAEALDHFSWLDSDVSDANSNVFVYPDLFIEAGDGLRLQRNYTEAIRFYGAVEQAHEEYQEPKFLADLANCYRMLADYDQAERCFISLLDNSPDDERGTHQKLVHMFNSAGMPDRAKKYQEIAIVNRRSKRYREKKGYKRKKGRVHPDVPIESIEQRDSRSGLGGLGLIAYETSAKKVEAKEKRIQSEWRSGEYQESLQPHFNNMAELKKKFEAGDDEARVKWMSRARSAIDRFRQVAPFFQYDRHVKFYGYTKAARHKQQLSQTGREAKMAAAKISGNDEASLEQQLDMLEEDDDFDEVIPTDYCEVEFSEWLDCILEYALLLAIAGDRVESYDFANVAPNCNVFYHNKESMFTIHVVWMMCAMVLNDHQELNQIQRWFVKEYQFFTDAYRMFAAVNRICNKDNSIYTDGPLGKFVMRHIRAMDWSLAPRKERQKPYYKEKAGFLKDSQKNDIIAEEYDVALLTLYGHILFTAQSYSNSLHYFYRAYALDPTNPMVLMSLALAYIHYALKRQSDNRQTLIMQGFSFLFVYYDARKLSKWAPERQEAEFNVAKVFHMLGLVHLAIPYYEKCLLLSEEVQKQTKEGGKWAEDYSREAAYALQGIWMQGGQRDLASEIGEKWLVL